MTGDGTLLFFTTFCDIQNVFKESGNVGTRWSIDNINNSFLIVPTESSLQ